MMRSVTGDEFVPSASRGKLTIYEVQVHGILAVNESGLVARDQLADVVKGHWRQASEINGRVVDEQTIMKGNDRRRGGVCTIRSDVTVYLVALQGNC